MFTAPAYCFYTTLGNITFWFLDHLSWFVPSTKLFKWLQNVTMKHDQRCCILPRCWAEGWCRWCFAYLCHHSDADIFQTSNQASVDETEVYLTDSVPKRPHQGSGSASRIRQNWGSPEKDPSFLNNIQSAYKTIQWCSSYCSIVKTVPDVGDSFTEETLWYLSSVGQ